MRVIGPNSLVYDILDQMNVSGCGPRRPRLIACGVVRLGWFGQPIKVRRAITTAEWYADQPGDPASRQVLETAWLATADSRTFQPDDTALAAYAVRADGDLLWSELAELLTCGWPSEHYRRQIHGVINDIRPPTLARWPYQYALRGEGLALAEAAYSLRTEDGLLDPNRLHVLADWLEEDGFGKKVVLEHLHAPGPHCMGCWSLDWLMGKSK